MIKFSNKSLLTLALVLAVCVAALVYQFLNNIQQRSNDTATVIVAKIDILANTAITADMVEEAKISRRQLQPGAVSGLQQVVGAYAKENIPVQAQITESQILNTSVAGFAGSIPRDKRAVSVAVTDVTGVAGLIKPGDYVDVIAVVEPASSNAGPVANMIIQNVLVLATDKTVTREEKGSVAKESQTTTVTLAVTPDEAVALGLAGTKETVALALRPFAPADNGNSQAVVKTLNTLMGNAVYASAAAAAPTPASVPVPNISGFMQSLFPSAGTPAPGTKSKIDYSNKKVIPVIKGTTTQDVFVE